MESTEATDIIDNLLEDCLTPNERKQLLIYSMGILTGLETKETRFWFGLGQILIGSEELMEE